MKALHIILFIFPSLLFGEINWKGDLQKPFSVAITLSSNQINKDEWLNFDIELQSPSSYHIDMESLAEQLEWSANPLAPSIKIAEKKIETHQNEKGELESHFRALLQPLKEGKLLLSPLKVIFEPEKKGDKTVEVLTPVFEVQVLSPADTPSLSIAPLIPMQPQFPLGLTEANRQLLWEKSHLEELKKAISQHSFPWLSILLLLCLGVIGWVGYLIKEQLPKRKSMPLPSFPPKIKAIQSLQELDKQNLIDRGLYQAHSIALSTIFLTFLEEHFSIKLKELTTPEIEKLHLLPESNLHFLKKIDKIKFAKKTTSKEDSYELEKELQSLLS